MNKIQIAATLLREVAKNTTDAAAFRVVVGKNDITLSADEKRNDSFFCGTAFYHSREVVDICRSLGLSFYFSAKAALDEFGSPCGKYEVRIYDTAAL